LKKNITFAALIKKLNEMDALKLKTKKTEIFREVLGINDENILSDVITYIRKAKSIPPPPEGFMTGDEFERRVKARVTKFYKENGLL
jgi:hypothetical protein